MNMKKRSSAVLATSILTALAAAAYTASAHADSFKLEHSDGVVTLPASPQRIVSFDLAVLDTLAKLDQPVAGVPKSQYERTLSDFKDTTVVGTLFEPDFDVLKEVKPDLIFAGGRSQAAIPELKTIAPTATFNTDPKQFLKDFRNNNLKLADAFGKKDIATAALAEIDKDLEQLHERNKGKTAAMLFTIKGNVIAHAPGDRFGYAYALTGTESVLPAKDPNAPVAPRPQPNTPEAKAAAEARAKAISDVAKADPDWLIVLDRGAINGGEKTAKETLAKHPELSQTQAFKEGRVYYADPNGWYVVGGGLNNMKAITGSLLAEMK